MLNVILLDRNAAFYDNFDVSAFIKAANSDSEDITQFRKNNEDPQKGRSTFSKDSGVASGG